MALQTQVKNRAPRKEAARPDKGTKTSETNVSVPPQWDENSPSYLDAVLAALSTLTDEDKEAIHLSLQG